MRKCDVLSHPLPEDEQHRGGAIPQIISAGALKASKVVKAEEAKVVGAARDDVDRDMRGLGVVLDTGRRCIDQPRLEAAVRRARGDHRFELEKLVRHVDGDDAARGQFGRVQVERLSREEVDRDGVA